MIGGKGLLPVIFFHVFRFALELVNLHQILILALASAAPDFKINSTD